MPKNHARRWARRRGNAALVAVVTIAVMLGFSALAVDMGHLYFTRGRLQNAADSAAHAGAQRLNGDPDGIVDARAVAKTFSEKHIATGSDVVIRDEDIDFGHWYWGDNDDCSPAPCFYSLGTAPSDEVSSAVNAVKVTTRRATETNDSVDNFFGGFVGRAQTDVTTFATAVAGGPSGDCGFPLVVPDCAIEPEVEDGTCDYCMVFQDDGSDNAGWTAFDGSASVPRIAALVEGACYLDGAVSVDPDTQECSGTCNGVTSGDEITVNNGNMMNDGNANFCPLIQDILQRGDPANTPVPFVVKVPVFETAEGEVCEDVRFANTKFISGFATLEIQGAKCSNADDPVVIPGAICATPPSSGKYVIATLRCDMSSDEHSGGGFFGLDALHIRLVE